VTKNDQNGGNPFLAVQNGGRLFSSSQLHSLWILAMKNDKKCVRLHHCEQI